MVLFPAPSVSFRVRCGDVFSTVGNLVVRASDSRPEGLGSMLEMPPNTFRVHTEYVLVKSVLSVKSCGRSQQKSQMQGTGEHFPPLQFQA
ncbi:hypothetical protein TNCV_3837121 [Trichonephila clavipes]|nr:hypothetical protein TNCV_3837121 [Trichonephila clavipes]